MTSSTLTKSPIDIELIAQRVLKLAEIATLEHLEALVRSQAEGLMEVREDLYSLDYGFDGTGM